MRPQTSAFGLLSAVVLCGRLSWLRVSFYRAMDISAKRGIAIVILSVRLSVCLYVCAL